MNSRPCKACGASIIWIKSTAGKAIPCNSDPVYYKRTKRSSAKVVLPNGEVITAQIIQDSTYAEGYGYIPHWSTCTNPNQFRKERHA